MILRIVIVIPAYDMPRTISRVARDVIKTVPHPIVILDDGSATPVSETLYSFEVKDAIERGRVRVVRFDEPMGKGAALRYSFRDLAAAGFTHVITLDGDDLIPAGEIAKLVDVGRKNPWDIILGRRSIERLPPRSLWDRVVRRLVAWSVRLETGARLKDPRSTFRMYPLLPLQTREFISRSDEFESEVLIRSLWSGTVVREVPVAVNPADPGTAPARSAGWGKTLRASTMNLLLLAASLVRGRNDPGALARAVGVGVFVGCTPLVGLHAPAAVACAVLFRLNVVAALIGSRVSAFPLMPLLIFASVYIGQNWLMIPQSTGYMSHFYRWAAGSVVLGVILGVVLGLITFVAARAAQNPRPVDRAARGGASLLRVLVRRAGRPAATFWIYFAASFYSLTSWRIRSGLNEFYRVLDPRLKWIDLVRARFRHLCTYLEMQADQFDEAITARTSGETKLESAVLTASLGSFDVADRALGDASDRRVYKLDQPGPRPRFEIIPFLGHLAAFDVTALRETVRRNEPLVTAFAIRGEGEYEIHARTGRRYAFRDDAAEDVQIFEWASRFVVQLEFNLRRNPDQWTKLYPFWSTIPPGARDGHDHGVPIEDLGVPSLKPRGPLE